MFEHLSPAGVVGARVEQHALSLEAIPAGAPTLGHSSAAAALAAVLRGGFANRTEWAEALGEQVSGVAGAAERAAVVAAGPRDVPGPGQDPTAADGPAAFELLLPPPSEA